MYIYNRASISAVPVVASFGERAGIGQHVRQSSTPYSPRTEQPPSHSLSITDPILLVRVFFYHVIGLGAMKLRRVSRGYDGTSQEPVRGATTKVFTSL